MNLYELLSKYQILIPKFAPKLSPTPYSNKTKDKNINNDFYGKRKGFIHSGSDFD